MHTYAYYIMYICVCVCVCVCVFVRCVCVWRLDVISVAWFNDQGLAKFGHFRYLSLALALRSTQLGISPATKGSVGRYHWQRFGLCPGAGREMACDRALGDRSAAGGDCHVIGEFQQPLSVTRADLALEQSLVWET